MKVTRQERVERVVSVPVSVVNNGDEIIPPIEEAKDNIVLLGLTRERYPSHQEATVSQY